MGDLDALMRTLWGSTWGDSRMTASEDFVPGKQFIIGPRYAIDAGFQGLITPIAGRLLKPRNLPKWYEYAWVRNTCQFNEFCSVGSGPDIQNPETIVLTAFWIKSPYTKHNIRCQMCGWTGHAGCSLIVATDGERWWPCNGGILWDTTPNTGDLTMGDLELMIDHGKKQLK